MALLPLLRNVLRRGIKANLGILSERLGFFFRTGYLHTAERSCPEFPNQFFEKHNEVYRFLCQFVVEKEILDVGCGTGHGSVVLAELAKRVEAVDYSPQAIRYAKRHYSRDNLSFRVMNGQKLEFTDDSFDVVLSSEVFEHLHDQEGHLREVRRVLRADGLCIIGTPNPEISEGRNEFHTKENTFSELRDLLSLHLREVAIIETLLEPPTERQRLQRAERIRSGIVGFDPRSPIRMFGREIDRTYLHNTHSFLCFARK